MKHNRFLLALALLLAAAPVRAQLTPLPKAVHTLVFEKCKAIIVPDTVTSYEDRVMDDGSNIRVSGGEMTFSKIDRHVVIHLAPGKVNRFVVSDKSEVHFAGTFHFPGNFELVASNAAKVTLGGIDDTVSAQNIILALNDGARVAAKSRLQPHFYDFNIQSNSRLKAFLVECVGTEKELHESAVHSSVGNSVVEIAYLITPDHIQSFYKDGGSSVDSNRFAGKPVVFNREEIVKFFYEKEDEIKNVEEKEIGNDDESFDLDDYDFSNPEDVTEFFQNVKKKVNKINKGRTWGPNLDFAWGFHNWSKDRFNGFAGTDDDAAVRTSFNHILLTFNYPVLTSKRVALYAGLGLEWDKYKFHRGDIHFDETAEPYHLYNGTVANSESRLLTRYVILPIEVKFDLGRHWKLGIAAIPGIHWSGSHTGLRRDITSGDDETNIKDFSVNKYINPYKLDARIAVQYHSIGIYFQASMLSAFKGSCDELFPVKFGIIL